jgi:transcriptional regulator with XRE-family HTH domain
MQVYAAARSKKRENIMEIGEHLFSLRQKSGKSLQEVADKVGVSKAHIWELEKGRSKKPSFDLVRRLASHYGVSVDVLTGDTAEPEPQDLQVDRIHRALDELTERDRNVVEDMIRLLRTKHVVAS